MIRTRRCSVLVAPAALLVYAASASAQTALLPRAGTAAVRSSTSLAVRPVPPGIVTFNGRLMAAAQPAVSGWVRAESRALLSRGLAPGAMLAVARSDVLQRFAGQWQSGADVETLVQLVLAQCAQDAQTDLEAMMEQAKAANDARWAQRSAGKAMKAPAAPLSELRADELLPLQQAMDRKSQLEAMISKIMKAGAESSSSSIANLK